MDRLRGEMPLYEGVVVSNAMCYGPTFPGSYIYIHNTASIPLRFRIYCEPGNK